MHKIIVALTLAASSQGFAMEKEYQETTTNQELKDFLIKFQKKEAHRFHRYNDFPTLIRSGIHQTVKTDKNGINTNDDGYSLSSVNMKEPFIDNIDLACSFNPYGAPLLQPFTEKQLNKIDNLPDCRKAVLLAYHLTSINKDISNFESQLKRENNGLTRHSINIRLLLALRQSDILNQEVNKMIKEKKSLD